MYEKIKYLIAVNILFFFYSITSVLGKLAAKEGEVNERFLLLYAGSLTVMGLYAVCWQQIIKKLPLMTAYANKAVVIIWGMLWGILFFGESITIGKLSGILLVIIGVAFFALGEGGTK